MNVHRALHDSVRGFGIHQIEDRVHRLVASCTEQRGAEDLFAVAIDEDAHKSLRLALFDGAGNARHRPLAGQYPPPTVTCLGQTHADAAQWRVGVKGICGDPLADAALISVEHIPSRRRGADPVRRDDHIAEYFALLLACAAGMAFFVGSANLIVMFLSLEWFSIALYVMCAIDYEREGVGVRLNAECISLARRGDEIVARVDCTAGAPEVAGSHLLLAVGRIPTIWISTKPGCAATSAAT